MTLLLLYCGPPTPPDASHEGWPEWFPSLGEKLVDRGSPMANGFVVRYDGATSEAPASLNGYSIIRVENREQALGLLREHPLLAQGADYSIQVFEVPAK